MDDIRINARSVYMELPGPAGKSHGIPLLLFSESGGMLRESRAISAQEGMPYGQLMMQVACDVWRFTRLAVGCAGLPALFDLETLEALNATGAQLGPEDLPVGEPCPIPTARGWSAVLRDHHMVLTPDPAMGALGRLGPLYDGPVTDARGPWLAAARRLGVLTLVMGAPWPVIPGIPLNLGDFDRAAERGLLGALRVPIEA